MLLIMLFRVVFVKLIFVVLYFFLLILNILENLLSKFLVNFVSLWEYKSFWRDLCRVLWFFDLNIIFIFNGSCVVI